MTFSGPDINWVAFTPPLVLLLTAALAVLFALYQKSGRLTAQLSLLGLILAALFNVHLFQTVRLADAFTSFGLRYLADTPALAFNFVILIGAALAVLVSYHYLERTGLDHPEYYPLILLSACGAMVMAAAGDLIILLLGLEIMSLAVYVLSAWRQGSRESEEAGMKYFLLGAFASAFLVYGIALLYGASGHFVYAEITAALRADGFDQLLLATLGGLMVLAGLAFKAALAPFHQWAPDAYTGAPTPVTAFMSAVVKTAAIAALLRVFSSVFPELLPLVNQVFAVLVGLTLVLGNLAAFVQRGVKRMLAYSAVAHAGYLGLAVLAAGSVGTRAAIWYLTAYTLMNIGAFAVLTLISDKNDRGDDLERFAGLGRIKPGLAAALTVFLLSLAGIPPLAGFTGKILVFQAALQAGYVALAIIGIVMSVVAVVYYFRVVATMYFREPEYELPTVTSRATGLAILITAAGTVLLGIFPGWWYGLLQVGQQLLAGL
jgi:NADH-quinone oxidoreductase subunit N